jgi:hypothetical protein
MEKCVEGGSTAGFTASASIGGLLFTGENLSQN